MIYVIITSYNEPKATLKAVKIILNEKLKLKVIVVDPFPEVGKFLKENIKSKNFEFFLDPGEGKTQALNIMLERLKSNNNDDIIVFTDGDVFLKSDAISELIKKFNNNKVGCVTGKPVTSNPPNTMYGYWAKVLYAGADLVRKRLDKENKFFQCSGYLFAIRNNILKEIPMDVGEDAIMPYLIWKKSYKIAYADKAEVYVKYPDNWKDWVNQRVRTIKGHENISKLYPEMPRTKSFWNEIKEGALFVLLQPRNFSEIIWTLKLYFARLYIYYKAFKEIKQKQTVYDPGWREVEIKSTKPLD